MAPNTKETATESKIPMMIVIALAELMYRAMLAKLSPACMILSNDTATAAPSNSKTTDTVVEVGRP